MSDYIKRLLLQELLRMNNMGEDADGDRNDLWPGPADPFWKESLAGCVFHLCHARGVSFTPEQFALLPGLHDDGLVAVHRLNQDSLVPQWPVAALPPVIGTHKWTVTDAGKAFLAGG